MPEDGRRRKTRCGPALLLLALLVGVPAAAVVSAPMAAAESPGTLPARPPGPYYPLTPGDHASAATFERGKPVVGTSYFYWYDNQTRAHIIDHDGSDALTTHPADTQTISYRNVSWHARQLQDMIDAGIDFMMPVYWGVPGDYASWSFAGIPPLVQAHDQLLRAGKHPPQIGLFYDTSILRYNHFRPDGSPYHVDLTTAFGRQWFYTAIRDFFSMVPPAKWARIDGRPIVFLYSASFAKAQDPNQMDTVYKHFRRDFAVTPFLVKHLDWLGTTEATYQWGGAIELRLDEQVAALGPGYDHSAVPGRSPLVVERKDGQTYSRHWQRLLSAHPQRRPWMVHVETWNEWHEGTDIAHSREYGRAYIDLTRRYGDLWRQGAHLTIPGPYQNAQEVRWQPGGAKGITLREPAGDGIWQIRRVEGREAVAAQANAVSPQRYIYFLVNDSFIFDGDMSIEITITYLDAGCSAFQVQYDNADPAAGAVQGAFRGGETVRLTGSGQWRTVTLPLARCRFANRANGADFRLAPLGETLDLVIADIILRK
ncbi:MAG: DUF5010 domain-containing protein [Sedimentisphaerales bacterium]|nr:DUF5010 domain-containing protein [Sedimentisphaerales bacterium]